MSVMKHTHRYERTFPNRRRVEAIWKCSIPGCSHWLPYNTTVLGRFSVCYECGNTFTIEETHLTQDKPICLGCASPDVYEYADLEIKVKEDE